MGLMAKRAKAGRDYYIELLVGRKVIWRGKAPELSRAHRRLHDKYCHCRRGETCRVAFNHVLVLGKNEALIVSLSL